MNGKPASATELAFVVRDDVPAEAIASSLHALLPARRHPIDRHRFTLLDTVDGRVRRAGARLMRTGMNGATTIIWQRRGAADRFSASVGDPVCFAWDLPDGPLRHAVADTVGPRRLFEQACAEEYGAQLDVLDDDGKIVARVRIVSGRARLPDDRGPWERVPTMITLTGLRGYEGTTAQLVPLIESRPGVECCPDGRDAVMLNLIGAASEPAASRRVNLPLDVRADVGARRIHAALLATLVEHEGGVRGRLDTEYLHDFRVAVRRTRSLLRQIRGVFPPPVVEHFAVEFSWLARLTGPPRDLDVLMLSILSEAQGPPGSDADVLLAFLGDLQKQAHRRVVEALDGKRYARLISGWRTFLDGPGTPRRGAPNAAAPLVDVVSRRAWRLSRRISATAGTIDEHTTPARLHEVRIDAKKLRYLIDVTPDFYEPAALQHVLRALKQLQRVLGDSNDAHVQAGRLLAYRRRVKRAAGSAAIEQALTRLAADRRRRGATLRTQVLAALAAFQGDATRSACRRAFRRSIPEEIPQ